MNASRLLPLALTMFFGLSTLPSTAAGDPIGIVDQELNPLDESVGVSSLAYLYCCHAFHQSFTTGLSGQLSAVQVLVAPGTPGSDEAGPTGLTLSLWRTVNNTITALTDSPLATVHLPATAVSEEVGFVTADLLDAAIFVRPGEQLAISLSTASAYPSGYIWVGSFRAYSGGASAFWTTGPPPVISNDADFGFRTFVVEGSPDPVPEPASIWLAAAGAALVIRRARRAKAIASVQASASCARE